MDNVLVLTSLSLEELLIKIQAYEFDYRKYKAVMSRSRDDSESFDEEASLHFSISSRVRYDPPY